MSSSQRLVETRSCSLVYLTRYVECLYRADCLEKGKKRANQDPEVCVHFWKAAIVIMIMELVRLCLYASTAMKELEGSCPSRNISLSLLAPSWPVIALDADSVRR